MEQTLGKKIAQLRRQKGMTQDTLAEKMGVSPQAVSKWENDQTCPDISLLPALARLFEVTVDELLSNEATPAVSVLPKEEIADLSKRILRIVVESQQGDKVKVNLPLSLVEAAIEMGMSMPQVTGNDALKNIDIKHIIDLVHQGVVGNLVEVESADGDTVRIFVE